MTRSNSHSSYGTEIGLWPVRSLIADFLNAESAAFRHPEWAADMAVAPAVDLSEAIVVTGFWRSGTTWLQESLSRLCGAKTVFEPLHPSLETYRQAIRADHILPKYDRDYLDLHMPYVRTGALARSKIGNYLRLGMRSLIPGLHVRNARPSRDSNSRMKRIKGRVRTALRTRIVFKTVRCHFLIGELQQLFGSPLMVHIRRDPRAIIASMRRESWLDHWAGTLSLTDQLIRPKDGRIEYLGRWFDDIRQIDQQDVVARWAAYWALMERFVKEIPEHDPRVVLQYEGLVRGGAAYLSEQLGSFLGRDITPEILRKDSATTSKERMKSSAKDRIRGWEKVLEDDEIEQIEQVVAHFDMEEGLNA